MNEDRVLGSRESEQAALGAILLGGNDAFERAAETRLRPSDFYYLNHGVIYRAMQRVYDAGGSIDSLTLREDLERHGKLEDAGGPGQVEALAASAPVAGNLRDYCRRVRVLAGLRAEVSAARNLIAANMAEDSTRRADAFGALMESGAGSGEATSDPEALAEMVREHLADGGGVVMKLPFPKLNDCVAGGLRLGEMTILGGHSSHGKSAFSDQIGEFVSQQGFRVHAYINEMTRLQRAIRMTARTARVDSRRIMSGDLTESEIAKVERALSALPFGITDVGGWTAADIARDIRRSDHELVIVDLLHEVDYADRQELDRNCRILARAAKQANCHVIATAHLNEKRVQTALRPPPTLGDIRDSGSLKNIVDNVLFVWRYQDEDSGLPLDDSWLYFAKVRNGETGRTRALFNGAEMRFERHLKDQQHEIGAPGYEIDVDDGVWPSAA